MSDAPSHHDELMNVIVRLTYDPDFVERVYATPNEALADTSLTAVEIGWLLANDPRSWQTDTTRRHRALVALQDEFSVSLSVLAQAKGAPLPFFSSPTFHAAIMSGSFLALAFGQWLMTPAWCAPATSRRLARRLTLMASIEHAGARVRRAQAVPPGDALVLSPKLALLETTGGALALYDALRTGQRPLPTLTGVAETLLVEDGAGGLTYEVLSGGLREILSAAHEPVDRQSLVELATTLGLVDDEAAELIDQLVGDGVLRPCERI